MKKKAQLRGTYFLLVLMSLGMTLISWRTEQDSGVIRVCIFCLVASLGLFLREQFQQHFFNSEEE